MKRGFSKRPRGLSSRVVRREFCFVAVSCCEFSVSFFLFSFCLFWVGVGEERGGERWEGEESGFWN